MFLRKIIPIWAVLSCACFALPAFAQEGPTEEERESARERLQQGLSSDGLPPAAFESDPVPDWAVPNHTPNVLPDIAAEQQTERSNAEVVDPNILSSQQKAERKAEPQKPVAVQKSKPEKPAVAQKKEEPKLKTGRAAADGEKKQPQKKRSLPAPKAAPTPMPAPIVVLPGTLRP